MCEGPDIGLRLLQSLWVKNGSVRACVARPFYPPGADIVSLGQHVRLVAKRRHRRPREKWKRPPTEAASRPAS
jgi:hypothetical protein